MGENDNAGAGKARHPHILHGITLSFMVGFDGNTKSYFIPRFQNTLDHPAGGESSDSVASDANLASFEEQELRIRRAQLQAASALNINKEEDFFNRSTRYYKYLQVLRIPGGPRVKQFIIIIFSSSQCYHLG